MLYLTVSEEKTAGTAHSIGTVEDVAREATTREMTNGASSSALEGDGAPRRPSARPKGKESWRWETTTYSSALEGEATRMADRRLRAGPKRSPEPERTGRWRGRQRRIALTNNTYSSALGETTWIHHRTIHSLLYRDFRAEPDCPSSEFTVTTEIWRERQRVTRV